MLTVCRSVGCVTLGKVWRAWRWGGSNVMAMSLVSGVYVGGGCLFGAARPGR